MRVYAFQRTLAPARFEDGSTSEGWTQPTILEFASRLVGTHLELLHDNRTMELMPCAWSRITLASVSCIEMWIAPRPSTNKLFTLDEAKHAIVYVTTGDADAAHGHAWSVPLSLESQHVLRTIRQEAERLGDARLLAHVSYHGSSRAAVDSIQRSSLKPSFGMMGTARYTGDFWKAARYAGWDQEWRPRAEPCVLRLFAWPRIVARRPAVVAADSCKCAMCEMTNAVGADHTASWKHEGCDVLEVPPTRTTTGRRVTSNTEWAWAACTALVPDGHACVNIAGLLTNGARDAAKRCVCIT